MSVTETRVQLTKGRMSQTFGALGICRMLCTSHRLSARLPLRRSRCAILHSTDNLFSDIGFESWGLIEDKFVRSTPTPNRVQILTTSR